MMISSFARYFRAQLIDVNYYNLSPACSLIQQLTSRFGISENALLVLCGAWHVDCRLVLASSLWWFWEKEVYGIWFVWNITFLGRQNVAVGFMLTPFKVCERQANALVSCAGDILSKLVSLKALRKFKNLNEFFCWKKVFMQVDENLFDRTSSSGYDGRWFCFQAVIMNCSKL